MRCNFPALCRCPASRLRCRQADLFIIRKENGGGVRQILARSIPPGISPGLELSTGSQATCPAVIYPTRPEPEPCTRFRGIGLAMENATQFQDILSEAGKAFLILLVMDLVLTGPGRWFEQARRPGLQGA